MQTSIKQSILTIIGIMLLFMLRTPAIAANASLSWDANTESDLAGYKVYYGTASRSYGAPVDVGNQTAYIVTGLSEGQTYYFAVTAYNNADAESAFSAEVSKTFADTVSPVLSSMAAGSITGTGAVITWTTNEAATAQVEYGTTTAYGSSSALRSTLLTSHTRTLSGLAPSTLYHYRVISRDAAGNTAASGDNTFTTAVAPDTTPPAISGISAGNLTPTSATVNWTTNESADTQIQYGPTTAYGSSTPLNTTLSTAHSQNLTGLTGATTYHYRVLSKDAAGNLATSGDNTFTTPAPPDTTPPTLSGITAGNLTSNGVTISWTTNEPADTQFQFGTTTAYGSTTSLNSAMTTSHNQTITGLTASTTYHFRVLSKDAAGNLAVSGNNTFTTKRASLGLARVSAKNITKNSATISWTTDISSTSQVEYEVATTDLSKITQPKREIDLSMVTEHNIPLDNLSPSTTYLFQVTSTDALGNTETSAEGTFTTAASSDPSGDTTGPLLSQITVSDARADRVTVSWGTDKPSTTQVEYGLTTSYGSLTTLNATLLNNHSEILSGLQAETVYHYRVRSADAAGNLSLSADQTFTTPPLGDITPPADVENFTAVPGVQTVTLNWVNPSDADFVGVRVVYRTDRFPTDLNDGTLLGDFAGQPDQPVSVIHAGLESNVTYYYSASSYDRSGNFQNTARASAMPLGIAESRSTSQGDGGSAAGGGCAMIAPMNGQAQGPLDSAEWLGLMGLVLAGLLRKGYQGNKSS